MTTETKILEMPERNVEEIEDAVIVDETKKDEKPRPYLVVRRVLPDLGTEDRGDETEGISLFLPEDGNLSPDMINAFIRDIYVTLMPDKRTLVATARLANNFLITESYSSLTVEEFNQDVAYEICNAKIRNKLWELMQFLFACGTFSKAKLDREYETMETMPTPNEQIQDPTE